MDVGERVGVRVRLVDEGEGERIKPKALAIPSIPSHPHPHTPNSLIIMVLSLFINVLDEYNYILFLIYIK